MKVKHIFTIIIASIVYSQLNIHSTMASSFQTGLSLEEIQAMQQLVAKKTENSADEMRNLDKTIHDELPSSDVKLIQRAVLHKLKHLQEEASILQAKTFTTKDIL